MMLHLDGDVIKYRCGFAAEKMHYKVYDPSGELVDEFQYKKDLDEFLGKLDENYYEVVGERVAEPVANALHNVKSVISEILEDLQTTQASLVVYLSGKTNFRTELGQVIYDGHPKPGYKANRDELHKPVHGPAIVDYIKSRYKTLETVDEEADDAMGYTHYAMWEEDPESTCIVTVDKDLDMIPGHHYNFVKKEGYYVAPEEAELIFWRQLLTGDNTDNIPGLRGVGAKRAEKLLDGLSEPVALYKKALECYENQYGAYGKQALLENARMIWIRRRPNELWKPPA